MVLIELEDQIIFMRGEPIENLGLSLIEEDLNSLSLETRETFYDMTEVTIYINDKLHKVLPNHRCIYSTVIERINHYIGGLYGSKKYWENICD